MGLRFSILRFGVHGAGSRFQGLGFRVLRMVGIYLGTKGINKSDVGLTGGYSGFGV